ncbi:GIY-YIG nuclease family protein [Patescibacteria group bacterium]
MYTVYVLQDKFEKFYKGMTNNIKRRFPEHKKGKTKTTKKMEELKIVYTEEYETFEEARKRELYFKTSAGRRFLKKKLEKK